MSDKNCSGGSCSDELMSARICCTASTCRFHKPGDCCAAGTIEVCHGVSGIGGDPACSTFEEQHP